MADTIEEIEEAIEELDADLGEAKAEYNEKREEISKKRKAAVAKWHSLNAERTAGLPGVVAEVESIGGSNGSRS